MVCFAAIAQNRCSDMVSGFLRTCSECSVRSPDSAIGESHQPPALQLAALLIAKTAEKFYG
jgi:hypothetical protein